jgi:small subunit ribosomal protein S18
MRFKTKRIVKKRDVLLPARKKFCRLCVDKTRTVDYKDIKRLESFVRDRGKIISTRASGNCAKHQRQIARAIKKARFLSLLFYIRL